LQHFVQSLSLPLVFRATRLGFLKKLERKRDVLRYAFRQRVKYELKELQKFDDDLRVCVCVCVCVCAMQCVCAMYVCVCVCVCVCRLGYTWHRFDNDGD
jgi:hypothetical protein